MTHTFDIKKKYWRRYQIMQKKSYQHEYYRISEIGKYVIGKYKIDKYKISNKFKKELSILVYK